MHTDKSTVSLNPKEPLQSRWLSTVFSVISHSSFCQDSACVPMSPLWCITQFNVLLLSCHCTLQCLSHPKGIVMSVLAFLFFPKTQCPYSMPFSLLSVLLSCPSSTLSSVVVHLRHSVELLPPEGVLLLPPEPFSLASLLSSLLVSQFKRVVFCWINKLDQLTKWFDVV